MGRREREKGIHQIIFEQSRGERIYRTNANITADLLRICYARQPLASTSDSDIELASRPIQEDT